MDYTEPLEMLLPGCWQLTFTGDLTDKTGAGNYEFKLAGTFNANVQEIYSGKMALHGYWEVKDARLTLKAQAISSRCNSCLGGGAAHDWVIELEQVTDTAFTGVLYRENDTHPMVMQRC